MRLTGITGGAREGYGINSPRSLFLQNAVTLRVMLVLLSISAFLVASIAMWVIVSDLTIPVTFPGIENSRWNYDVDMGFLRPLIVLTVLLFAAALLVSLVNAFSWARERLRGP
ncbi:MAG: hypothetical protein V3S37_07865, partial [Dehalococcoidia bacterium]